ncbi:MAG: HigA family addiction module antitoxin [Chloroflexota bacterium]
MSMYDPPHPGEFIRAIYLEELGVSSRFVAAKLKVSPSTFTRLLNGSSRMTPEMALRLSKTLGRSPESWLAMQNSYDLWQTRQHFNVDEVEKLEVEGG